MEPSCLVFRPQWSLLSFNCWFRPGSKISGIERLSGRLATARDVARSYRCEARDYYRRWGASAKVPQLDLHHPELAPQVSQAQFPTVRAGSSRQLTGFSGILQVDDYDAYKALARDHGGAIQLASTVT